MEATERLEVTDSSATILIICSRHSFLLAQSRIIQLKEGEAVDQLVQAASGTQSLEAEL